MRKLLTLLLVLPLLGCGGGSGSSKEITVLAASSLTEAFGRLGQQFEKDHGIHVRLVLNSSTTLAQQAAQGAPGDVLATADQSSMQSAVAAGATTKAPVAFTSNVLVLVVPSANPAGLTSIQDLGKKGVKFVECVPSAPCGKVAAAVLSSAGVTASPASQEVDVKSVLAKVASGDADAGLVYASDAKAAAAQVRAIPIPGAEAARTTYFLAPLKQAGNATAAQQFVDLVQSAAGQQVLRASGFGAP